jgi:hypothetical protein
VTGQLLAGQAIRVCALYFFLRLGALALPPALAAAAGRFLSLAARSTISFWRRSNSASSISWGLRDRSRSDVEDSQHRASPRREGQTLAQGLKWTYSRGRKLLLLLALLGRGGSPGAGLDVGDRVRRPIGSALEDERPEAS